MSSGYSSVAYARTFSETVLDLPACRGNLLVRSVPGTSHRDACGCYPLFSCANWDSFPADIGALPTDLLTVSMVVSPFSPFSEVELRALFPLVRPLSAHYLVDLNSNSAPSRHHRRKLRSARPGVEIALVDDPASALDAWLSLYEVLVAKHDVRGLRRFSRTIFSAQLQVPGTVLIAARKDGRWLGIDWYYQDGASVFSHLSAYSAEGYQLSISYPMMAAAIDYFRGRASILDIGGAPAGDGAKGIADFKSGWTNLTAPSWFCGRALKLQDYLTISDGVPPERESFFPCYRRSDY